MEIEEYIGHKIPVEPIKDEFIVSPKPPVKMKRNPPNPNHKKNSQRRPQRQRRSS
jgi:hypothetical protein